MLKGSVMVLVKTLETCLGIREGETVLLLSDSEMADVSSIIREAILKISRKLIFMEITPRRIHGAELPRAVSDAMASSDVVIGATQKSMTHTQATRRAVENGARVASMPGITVDMLVRGGMIADYHEVAKAASSVSDVLSKGNTIEIKTSLGTDFKAEISEREGYADTGLMREKGDFGNLPGGEGFIAPVEGRSNGRIFFDGPIASSGLSHEPISVDVVDGCVAKTDNPELQEVFKDFEDASCVGEIGIGVNPKARLIGNILEDEKVLGTAHVAFGNNTNFGGKIDAKVHLDGIIKNPTILVDGEVIAKEGSLDIFQDNTSRCG
jgi:leucyl aminopeptidase (aminopeptidase T)